MTGGPTVGEVRAEDRPRKLEVVQIRICTSPWAAGLALAGVSRYDTCVRTHVS
jgi:hypothetical protein